MLILFREPGLDSKFRSEEIDFCVSTWNNTGNLKEWQDYCSMYELSHILQDSLYTWLPHYILLSLFPSWSNHNCSPAYPKCLPHWPGKSTGIPKFICFLSSTVQTNVLIYFGLFIFDVIVFYLSGIDFDPSIIYIRNWAYGVYFNNILLFWNYRSLCPAVNHKNSLLGES